MSLATKINDLTIKYSKGSFGFHSNDKLSQILIKNSVPNKPGAYIIYAKTETEGKEIIYIGKSGTMNTKGEFSDQMLLGRLKAKQDKISREKYYKNLIKEYNFRSLFFQWFVSFDENNKILPAKLECDLIQVYYDENKKLPLLNKKI
jgi:hypothetical protein